MLMKGLIHNLIFVLKVPTHSHLISVINKYCLNKLLLLSYPTKYRYNHSLVESCLAY